MSGTPHYFGIRHHGPGTARQLLSALDELRPVAVLVEGPSDASDLLPMLADKDMVPPVALLTYPADQPSEARFWPMAEYSPEYQAVLWAIDANVPVRFIDLPSTWQPADDNENENVTPEVDITETRLIDPIGQLASFAGYEDGESWWRNVIEENPQTGPVFTAIADAMTALREGETHISVREAAREAHMRLEVAKTIKESEGDIAVICGAWHVPALQAKYSQKDDRTAIRSGSRSKVAATWAPWTAQRLAFSSGYGAGVDAPRWCQHLWTTSENLGASWLTRIASVLREHGHVISTASVIEAERLSVALAAIRDRSLPGFEEYREAAIACMCQGEELLWLSIAPDILIGREVGSIPSGVPLAPLLEDLQRQQRKTRLKPEALESELSLDLRSESGLARSTLLHRLNLLGVQWGKLSDAGRSRGTFREKWVLAWQPEYAVELVENLIYGATIEQASSGRLSDLFSETKSLSELSQIVLSALTAQLPDAVHRGIEALEKQAAGSSDCLDLLNALSPMTTSLRYGEARQIDLSGLGRLFERVVIQAGISIRYAARNLDREAALRLRDAILASHSAIELIETDRESQTFSVWIDGLSGLKTDSQTSPLIGGLALRLLYQMDIASAEETATLLQRTISPGTAVSHAADFFEGFFEGAASSLIYDDALRNTVDQWLLSLEDEDFKNNLPLLRRVFSALDQSERSRLLDRIFGRQTSALPGLRLTEDADALWEAQFKTISAIIIAGRKS